MLINKLETNESTTKSQNENFKSMGFRACISDISTYLIEIERVDLNDPFRLRLLSYLKCFTNIN